MSDPDTTTQPNTLKRPHSEPSSPSGGTQALDDEQDQHARRRPRIESPLTEDVVDPELSVPLQEESQSRPHTDTFGFGDRYISWDSLSPEQIRSVEKHWDDYFMDDWADTITQLTMAEPRHIVSRLGLAASTHARDVFKVDPQARAIATRFRREYQNLEYYYELCTYCKPYCSVLFCLNGFNLSFTSCLEDKNTFYTGPRATRITSPASRSAGQTQQAAST